MFWYFFLGLFLLLVAVIVICFLEPIIYWYRKTATDIAEEPIRRLKQKELQQLKEDFNPLYHGPTRDLDPEIEQLISDNRLNDARREVAERLQRAVSSNNETLTRLYTKYTAKLGRPESADPPA